MELLTAADSEADQRRIAGGLLAHGLGVGDRVALCTTSSAAMLSAIIGALRIGVVPVLLNAGLLEHERDALLADARPDLVVDDAGLAALRRAGPVELSPWPLARPMHYTSGTTGSPKGVWSGVLSETEAAGLVAEEAELWQFEAGDRHLVCSPFHHSVSIRFGTGTLLAGGTVVVPGPFDAATVARAIVEVEPTTTFMVPAHLQRLLSIDALPALDGLRLLAHAGAPCPDPIRRRVHELVGIDRVWEFYGSTEGQFTACAGPEWAEHPGTVGRARAHRNLAADADGTIWCTVPAYARFEYWDDPAKTAAAWRDPAVPGAFGAFTVGDLGRLDDDGYLYLDGRRDDLIITGGVNVYPAEIEQALVRCDGVDAVAVFGVTDERWGQRVCAAVVGTAAPDVVLAFAREVLAPYKCPKQAFVVDELPETVTGKIQRARLPEVLGLA